MTNSKSIAAAVLGLCLLTLKTAVAQDRSNDVDIVDLYRKVIKKEPPILESSISQDKFHFSVVPAVGYTLETGFAAIVSANATFRTTKDSGNYISTTSTSIAYTQFNQIILPLQTYIWTRNNKYNIVTDWRFVKYPQYTYGLGGHTQPEDGYHIDYSNVHVYQTLLRSINKKLYAGLGYNFDYYWRVKEIDPPASKVSDFESYGVNPTVTASGLTANLLYDSRNNPVNADKGSFARVIYRLNAEAIGSDANWQSLIFDLRHFINLLDYKKSTLAFWSYDWFTVGRGDPPYLMLPSIGWDPSNNTGRGYIQGRFRGRNMLYLESEYRFGITRNGLLGGVVFVNATSVSEPITNRFETIAPAYGAGLRVKVNKFSNSNVSIDYGLGLNGSKGFFVNLGEVF